MRSVEQSGGGPQFDSMLNRAALTMRPNGAGRPGTGKRRRSQARDDALRDVPATGSTPAAAAHRRSWGPGDRTRFSHDSGRAASLTELPKIPLAALQSTVPWWQRFRTAELRAGATLLHRSELGVPFNEWHSRSIRPSY